MTLYPDIRLPADLPGLRLEVMRAWRPLIDQLNGLSEGKITATSNAYTTFPTTGTHTQGDFVKNSAPGAALSRYVILGWVCTASGSPGTWLECRVLTGN
jgi:hypothetical protein